MQVGWYPTHQICKLQTFSCNLRLFVNSPKALTARSSQGWRSMLRSKVSGILPRLWRVLARYVISSLWAAAGVCQFYQHPFLPPMHAHTDLSQLLQFRTSLCCPLHQDQKRGGASSRLCQYQEVASFPRFSTWLPGNEATSRGIHLHFICTSIRNWDQNLDWHKRTPGLLAFTYRTKWKPRLLVYYYQICDCDNRWSLPLVQKFTVLCNFWWYPYQHKAHLLLHLRSDPPW